MSQSLIYRHPRLYHLALRMLYGRRFQERYRAVLRHIPEGVSVVEPCAGDAYLFRKYLRGKVQYKGLEYSAAFVHFGRRHGVEMEEFNLVRQELPKADVVLLMASLYQFMPRHREIMDKLLVAAQKRVIVVEPVRNMADSGFWPLRKLAAVLTNPGGGEVLDRFNEATFREFFESIPARAKTLEPLGRDMLAVFDK